MGTASRVMGEQRGGERVGGGRSAAEALREHGPALGRVCMALLGDANDTSAALEHVAREAGARNGPDGVSERAWLMGLARVACATRLSKLPLHTKSMIDAPSVERGGGGGAGLARESLAKLRPTEREAVVLHLVGGLDTTDVAAACGVDVETAKTRIARGIGQLSEKTTSGEGEKR